MSARKVYRATAERDGRFWLLNVPEIERVTQARRLDQAEMMVRSLISIMTGEAEDSFDVDIHPQLETALSDVVVRALAAKGRAAAAQAEASNLQREAARALTESGMTIRDAGDLLGITHQRVAQLLPSRPERPVEPGGLRTAGLARVRRVSGTPQPLVANETLPRARKTVASARR
jgi:hypothetical protein